MKLIAVFNLPEQDEEYREFYQGPKALSVLRELANVLRSARKHGTGPRTVAGVEETLYRLLNEEGLELWG